MTTLLAARARVAALLAARATTLLAATALTACGAKDGAGAAPEASSSASGAAGELRGGNGAGRDPKAATATGRNPQTATDPHLIAALGDSITAGSPLWDPDPAFRAQIAARAGASPDPRSQWEHFYEQAHPGDRVRNCGVFGERTDEIRARLAACEAGAGTVVVQGGINDIAQGRPVADAAVDLQAIVRAVRDSGRRVALVEVLPWTNGYPAAAPGVAELNRRIHRLGLQEHAPVFAWYRALEDPRRPGRLRPGLTIDGDHPSVAGYRRLAALVRLP